MDEREAVMDAAPEWTARAPALHIIAYIACVGMANIILHEPTPCRNCPVPTRLSLAPLSHSRPRPRTRIPISSAYPLLPILSCCCVVQLGAVQQAGRPAALHYTHTHTSLTGSHHAQLHSHRRRHPNHHRSGPACSLGGSAPSATGAQRHAMD